MPLANLENTRDYMEQRWGKKPRKDVDTGMYIRRSIIGDANLEQEVAAIRKKQADEEARAKRKMYGAKRTPAQLLASMQAGLAAKASQDSKSKPGLVLPSARAAA